MSLSCYNKIQVGDILPIYQDTECRLMIAKQQAADRFSFNYLLAEYPVVSFNDYYERNPYTGNPMVISQADGARADVYLDCIIGIIKKPR